MVWAWDQGHLQFFQFSALRSIAKFVVANDFKAADRATLLTATGLDFTAPLTHSPWRQYSRALKLAMLVSERSGVAEPTPVAVLLAQDGVTTCDEYMHFLAEAFTSPSPALTGYSAAPPRYPLLFALRYLLAKTARGIASASLDEIIGAFCQSTLTGAEGDPAGQTSFLNLAGEGPSNLVRGRSLSSQDRRQPAESLRVLGQISYVHSQGRLLSIAIAADDVLRFFQQLEAVAGPRHPDGNQEIRRVTALFGGGSPHDFFDYEMSTQSALSDAGFVEGTKVEKTHIIIERNHKLRLAFFKLRPTSVCDVCTLDTKATYPWVERVIDLHHLLPLSSGTRTDQYGTILDDLVPVCPTCHRATHRYYGAYLQKKGRADFQNDAEARSVYAKLKTSFPGWTHA